MTTTTNTAVVLEAVDMAFEGRLDQAADILEQMDPTERVVAVAALVRGMGSVAAEARGMTPSAYYDEVRSALLTSEL